MQILIAVIRDLLTYFDPRTRRGLIRLVVLLVLLGLAARFLLTEQVDEAQPTSSLPAVTLATAGDFTGASAFSVIGTVEAVDEARIQSEAGGRVTAVYVELGDSVRAGSVIAELENASQRAAVLQAEGAYEAAQAGAAQSEVGVESAEIALQSAKTSAVRTFQNAYTTVSEVLYNSIDQIFTNPQGPLPGVRIEGGARTSYLNTVRVSLQTTLPQWQRESTSISTEDDLMARLTTAEENVNTVLTLVDTVIERLSADPSDYENTEFESLRSTLLGERSRLIGARSAIDSALTNLEQAQEALTQAELAGPSGAVSSADAQVKQALGSLRAAQANLAKTIIRTPISGVVNAIEVDQGDFIGVQTPVATIANNDALIVSSFLGQSDRERISIGDTVTLAGEYSGTVSAIAPAVDPTTGKIEVRIETTTEELENGQTVRISITNEAAPAEVPSTGPILVPLTAVKFTASAGNMFTVADGELVALPVEVGDISGSFVEIAAGIDSNTAFVVDARGLTAGREVTVTNSQ